MLFEDIRRRDFRYSQTTSSDRWMLQIATVLTHADIVLDFFAGSGTPLTPCSTLNKQDGGNRKFILVQLPEPHRARDSPTIADITKERVRRVIKKLNDEDTGKLDLEAPASRTAASGSSSWPNPTSSPGTPRCHRRAGARTAARVHVDHIREGRTADDLLYEILLKSGFPLTTPVETLTLAG